jgi:hypothetical protein
MAYNSKMGWSFVKDGSECQRLGCPMTRNGVESRITRLLVDDPGDQAQ